MKITPIKEAVVKEFDFMENCFGNSRIIVGVIRQLRESTIKEIQFQFKKQRLLGEKG